MKYFLLILFTIQISTVSAQSNSNYQKEIDAWHNQRIKDLKAPNGWVNLAGLFWLQPGKNRFGSAKENEIVFTHTKMPTLAGYFNWKENGEIEWVTAPGNTVTIKDSSIQNAVIFQTGKPGAALLALNQFRWNIIKRENKIGVRFRDLESPALAKFTDIERYPVDSKWRIAAHLETAPQSTVSITNILGQTNAESSPGKVVFMIDGVTYKLDALEETPGELFIIFGDATSGKETYPAGRFLYMPKPVPGGTSYIDFNKCFNPPCALSTFATCPLPPKQNILPVAIRAGEKDFELK